MNPPAACGGDIPQRVASDQMTVLRFRAMREKFMQP
jgi:hypothetical protein